MAEEAQKSIQEQYQDIIEKYDICMDAPPTSEILPSHKFIIIRHGFSQHNFSEKETLYDKPLKGKSDPRYKQLHMDPKYTDNPLHPVGIQQCLNHQKYINEIDFEIVFISPLQRALQTCIYLFATHPNRQNIKFVLMPELYECLCSSGCFGPNTLTSLRESINKLADQYNIKLDFSLVEQLGRYWQVKVLEDQNLSKALLDQINSDSTNDESTYQKVVYEAMEKTSSFFLETWKMLFYRTRKVIQKMLECEKTASKDFNKKIGLVSHGFLIKCLTASKIEENGRIEEGIIMNNCQLLPYSFQEQQKEQSNLFKNKVNL
ncbi:hypothetical protein ABPG74_011645 [Tetrahymena malaccensis]